MLNLIIIHDLVKAILKKLYVARSYKFEYLTSFLRVRKLQNKTWKCSTWDHVEHFLYFKINKVI